MKVSLKDVLVLQNNVLIEISKPGEETTDAGIIIPESDRPDMTIWNKVVKVGPKVEGIEAGDYVAGSGNYGGLTIGMKDYLIVPEEKIKLRIPKKGS
jgi:co-chaperonin GroES (HSP10)